MSKFQKIIPAAVVTVSLLLGIFFFILSQLKGKSAGDQALIASLCCIGVALLSYGLFMKGAAGSDKTITGAIGLLLVFGALALLVMFTSSPYSEQAPKAGLIGIGAILSAACLPAYQKNSGQNGV
jgi:drug/metabolite transporter (DMT)-like permease